MRGALFAPSYLPAKASYNAPHVDLCAANTALIAMGAMIVLSRVAAAAGK